MSGATLELLYFARLAELLEKRGERWPVAGALTGRELLAALRERYPALPPDTRLKLAVNQTHVSHNERIEPGDEVGVFEPVTGG